MFRIFTVRQRDIADEEQKECPIYIDVSFEKRIPTKNKTLCVRSTTISGKKDGANLSYELSTKKNRFADDVRSVNFKVEGNYRLSAPKKIFGDEKKFHVSLYPHFRGTKIILSVIDPLPR